MFQFARLISSGLFSGYAPVASGTVGSALFIVLWWIAIQMGAPLSLESQLLSAVLLFFIGTACTAIAIRGLKERGAPSEALHDPSFVVVDEWVGQWLALLAADHTRWFDIAAAFLLFRMFDITKIWPISRFEEAPGAWGIMLDDVVAGLFACMVLLSLHAVIS